VLFNQLKTPLGTAIISGVATARGGGEWVKIHPPSLEKMTQTEKLFKIARVFLLNKIPPPPQKCLATPLAHNI